MKTELTPKEIAILGNYRFVTSEPGNEVELDFSMLVKKESMSHYLKLFQEELRAPDMKTAASVFMKRHAFLAVLYLYSMSAFNKKLNVDPDNIILADAIKDGLWLPEFYLKSKQTIPCPDGQREEWRKEAVRHLFEDNLFPVMDTLSRMARISKLILWENVSVYIFWLYEKILSQLEDEEIKARAEADFFYLLMSAPGKLFGNNQKNPMARYYSEPVYHEESDSYIRMRKTCCFSYRLKEKGGLCKTCPRTCGA
ncbi:siderophore-iron reductase FhuF [Mesobacillus subterraneus]|uniref:Siderophore-iron reductase FhuF n=1 Tax=Mesobacillus subterraneus TaxID=285983 RepID=A0A3R9EE77_9BACI|nr:siderophore-iron reductase FhuF [Mesobacillus subterraneus]RSD28355.1 siderophore-iron reductase FhuF [Mesobacillus subterraneus]